MKKAMKSLLAALLMVSAAHATTHTNKTFLRPRPVLRNIAMREASWVRQNKEKNDENFGGDLQATLFYQTSGSKTDLGRYFGTKDSTGCVYDNVLVTNIENNATVARDLFSEDLVHDAANHVDGPAGSIRFRPESDAWGLRLDYQQDLDKLFDGLYLRVSTAIANVKNKINGVLKDETKVTVRTAGGATGPNPTIDGHAGLTEKTIKDYFTGNLSNDTSITVNGPGFDGTGTVAHTVVHKQEALKFARICCFSTEDCAADCNTACTTGCKSLTRACSTNCGTCSACTSDCSTDCNSCCKSDTALADIEVVLGYNVLQDVDKHFGINFGFVIPTGSSPDCVCLFESVSGNGGFWSVGAGFDGRYNFYSSDNMMLDIYAALDYRYLFEDCQCRTAGLLKADGCSEHVHGQWLLLGKKDSDTLIPAANVTTGKYNVEPGSQIDALIGLNLDWKGFHFDIGYNIFYQEAEKVCVKCWDNDTYGIAQFSYNSGYDDTVTNPTVIPLRNDDAGAPIAAPDTTKTLGGVFDPTNANHTFQGPLQSTHLNTGAAATPSQTTHKLYLSVAKNFGSDMSPINIGLGTSFEWADSNSAFDAWAIWGKLGFSF